MATEFEKFNFYNQKEKTLFDLNFKLNMGPARDYSMKDGMKAVNSSLELPILDIASLELAQKIFLEHFKNKTLASFMTQLGYIFKAHLPNTLLCSYDHRSAQNVSVYNGKRVALSPEEFELKINSIKEGISKGFLFNKGQLSLTPNPGVVNSMDYTRHLINLNALQFEFNILVENDKKFQPQLCLYSKSHIDKTAGFIKRINNFYSKLTPTLSALEKIKEASLSKSGGDTWITSSFSPDYGLFHYARGSLTAIEKGVSYPYKIKEKDFIDFAITLIERIRYNFQEINDLFVKNNLLADTIDSVEYQGSFARADDFENQKCYVYMAKNAKGGVGFVGINPANAKGYNSSRHSLSIVKDVSQALTFKTPNPLETGFKELTPDSYYIKDIHPLEIETKFSPTNSEYSDPKMQAIAAMLMKKELNSVLANPEVEKEALNSNLTPSNAKKNKI